VDERDLRARLLARPHSNGRLELAAVDPSATPMAGSRERADRQLAEKLGDRLSDLHDLMYANKETKVLVVLQGLDGSGKNGTIRHVVSKMNPAAVRVASFKEPTPNEEEHHFLWRIRQQLPEPGELVVFDRSHYEDLIVPLVTGEFERDQIEQRIHEVNEFENELVDDSTVVIKCLLHLSFDEQRERFLRRLRRNDKRWKFSEGDLDTRDRWSDFLAAYGEVTGATTTSVAPWYVIPSDHKWYRNWAVARIIAETLDDLSLTYPQPDIDVAAMRHRLGDR
jgi:PPK2 family polyphosphate:nucleotide phosphotransferase